MKTMQGKKIVLGVTGGIACYKSVEFARLLVKQGADVQVIMTQNATRFVAPLTFETVTQKPVLLHLFEGEGVIHHIDSARFADFMMIMPATASFMARLAHGFADDLLSAVCLATTAPIALVPAMNQQMWLNPATQSNKALLESRQIHVMETGFGEQACGEVGYGRMLEPEAALRQLSLLLSAGLMKKDLKPLIRKRLFEGKKILLTVGSTREPMDAVRYISNASSGKMGFHLARVFCEEGAQVTIVCGYCQAQPPEGCELIQVQTAQEMLHAVLGSIEGVDVFVGAAAVADYRPKYSVESKIKSTQDEISVTLVKNPDILAQVASLKNKPFTVGFALETDHLLENAQKKLLEKGLDVVIANLCSASLNPMGSDENEVFMLARQGQEAPLHLKKASKDDIARGIVDFIGEIICYGFFLGEN